MTASLRKTPSNNFMNSQTRNEVGISALEHASFPQRATIFSTFRIIPTAEEPEAEPVLNYMLQPTHTN